MWDLVNLRIDFTWSHHVSLSYPSWQKNPGNLKLLILFIQEGESPESGIEDSASKNDRVQLSDDREESDPSDEEFPAFPGEESAVIVDEKDSIIPEGKLLFEAPSALLEENVDLLGLDSDISPEQKQPVSEINASSSNADLLNNLLVDPSQISEETTGDLLGQGTDFFFSNQCSAATGSTSSAAAMSSGV